MHLGVPPLRSHSRRMPWCGLSRARHRRAQSAFHTRTGIHHRTCPRCAPRHAGGRVEAGQPSSQATPLRHRRVPMAPARAPRTAAAPTAIASGTRGPRDARSRRSRPACPAYPHLLSSPRLDCWRCRRQQQRRQCRRRHPHPGAVPRPAQRPRAGPQCGAMAPAAPACGACASTGTHTRTCARASPPSAPRARARQAPTTATACARGTRRVARVRGTGRWRRSAGRATPHGGSHSWSV